MENRCVQHVATVNGLRLFRRVKPGDAIDVAAPAVHDIDTAETDAISKMQRRRERQPTMAGSSSGVTRLTLGGE